MHLRRTYALVLIFCSGVALAQDFNVDSIKKAIERGKEFEPKIELPDIENSEGRKAAQQAAERFYSREYRKRIENEVERLKSEQFEEVLQGFKDQLEPESASTVLASGERIYIFISSSVPLSTLRAYAFELDRINDPAIGLVIRGFVGGMKRFKPTLNFIQNIFQKDESCDLFSEECETYNAAMSIDPALFRKYSIRTVPAIAYVRGITKEELTLKGEGRSKLNDREEADIVYGDISIEFSLEIIRRKTRNKAVENIIKWLRSGVYTR